jgi:Ni/Fe-hydrogenase subunit HybB-like protein
MKRYLSKLTFWKVVAAAILVAGAYSAAVRYFGGLGSATNLSDEFPWGLWIGFDVLCGVGLAAGGFTLAAIVYIFNVKRFEPIIRPTILTAFLGYLLVIVALLLDLGRPLQIWHAIIMWNPHSVMFEVAWCVMLYTTVLSLEFLPVVLERFKLTKAINLMKKVSIPLIIIGVLLSTLHQSSLGSLYLIAPEKLYGLWYSAYLPVFFYVSAIAAGCGMIILESFLSSRAFKRGLETGLLSEIGRVAVVMLAVYLTMRIADLADRHAFSLLFQPRMETYLFWLEISAGVLAPLVMLLQAKVRQSQNGLFAGGVLLIIGFVLNRMNVAISGMEAWAGKSYFPTWMEISVTLSIVVVGFILFELAAKYLPLFKHDEEHGVRVPAREWIEELKTVSQPN